DGAADPGAARVVRQGRAEELHAGAGRVGQEGQHARATQDGQEVRCTGGADGGMAEPHIKGNSMNLVLVVALVAQAQTLSTNQQRARDIFEQLININTTGSSGSTTLAANRSEERRVGKEGRR